MTLRGLYVGNSPADFSSAQQWLGGAEDIISARSGKADWNDWRSSLSWQIRNMAGVAAQKAWNVPLFPVQGNLHDGANGLYDADYTAFARQLVAAYGTTQPILVRTGEEFNGSWFGWSAQTDPQDYVEAYRHFVDAFRSVSGNFQFEWNVNIGGSMNPAAAYPGDNYVNFVGMDFYWDFQQSWSFKDPTAAFTYFKNEPYGLQWIEQFAAAHGKPTAYSEWGVNSPDAAPFLQLVKAWFDGHNVAYQIYWDSDADFAGKLDNGRYGAASDMFRTLFGASPAAGSALAAPASPDNTPSWLNGTDAGDTIVTGNNPTYVSGGAGSDTITVGGGNNHVWGNGQTSVAGATDGADFITAGAGCNYVNGNAGDDVITVGTAGSLGHNRVSGGQGNDMIVVLGAGHNAINGNLGNDQIYGGSATGANLLRGGQGNDSIFGGHGSDTLSGDLGDDLLVASGANGHLTVMTGGAGADRFDFTAMGAGASAGDRLQEVTDFTPGSDRIVLPFAVTDANLLIGTDASFGSVAAALGHAQQLFGNAPSAEVAALQVGGDTILFYSQAAHPGTLGGMIQLDQLSPQQLASANFTVAG